LLELGSGYYPVFTGRENMYMSCALSAYLPKKWKPSSMILSLLPIWVTSSSNQLTVTIEKGLGSLLEWHVCALSFADNIVSQPDIMIVDKVLAVGDMNFQAMCMTALTRVQKSGTTVLFVSHDIGVLRGLCSRGVYLEHGTMRAIGKTPDVAEQYIRTMRGEMNAETRRFSRVPDSFVGDPKIAEKNEQIAGKGNAVLKRSDEFDRRVVTFRYGSGGARVSYVELLNMDDEPLQSVEFNQ
jgi:lipopolysaccharide transport system ATP-binding protein